MKGKTMSDKQSSDQMARIERLAAELQSRLDELRQEIAQMQGKSDGRATRRTLRSFPNLQGQAAASPYDLSKVIPPTKTEKIDSIVGGRPTFEFPDCAAVGIEGQFFCSGTLIASNVVVTAKHCTEQENGPDIPITHVFLKGHDVDIPSSGKIYLVKEQFKHESADLMVLVLEDEVTDIEPRHVAQGDEINDETTETAHLVGFGTIDFNGMVGYGIKREVDVPIESLDCTDSPNGCLEGVELIAGHRGLNLDSCSGDSGGPLYIESSSGAYHLLGATSRGLSGGRVCGDGGIYVRVDRHIDWIRQVTGIDIPGPTI
jgi:hypothetical protein